MARNLSQGPVQVVSADVVSINDALRQVAERMDVLKGLSGRSVIHDRVGVANPVLDEDAVNQRSVGRDAFMTLDSDQDITGEKTFEDTTVILTRSSMSVTGGSIKIHDGDGNILHGMGDVVTVEDGDGTP